jgi:hypothetical protein
MEIFRTDGGGKTFTNERLFRVVSKVEKYMIDSAFEDILIVNDHKGLLKIHVNSLEYVDYIASVFLTFWAYENDYTVVVYFNKEEIKELSI